MPTKPTAEFRPMLAAPCDDMARIALPAMVSPKINGIRCIIHPKLGPITRNLKPIANKHVRTMLTGLPPFDGELIVGPITAHNVWNATSSAVMSRDGSPKFEFHVFDLMPFEPDDPYVHRYANMLVQLGKSFVKSLDVVKAVRHETIDTLKALKAYEAKMVGVGFEGIMVRHPSGLYKQGRSSAKEGWLFKVKRVKDAEAVIKGFTEKLHNDNEAKINKLGYTERSSHKENKRGAGTLGALIVKAELTKKGPVEGFFISNEVEFNIGTGFDDALRAKIWANRHKYMGKSVTFKYQDLSPEGKPIFPVFLGFRGDLD